MKFGLPLKLSVIFFLLSGFGIVAVTFISYLNASDLLQKQSLNSLSYDLQRESIALEVGMRTLEEDAIFLSQLPSVSGIIRAYNTNGFDKEEHLSELAWKHRLEGVFKTVIAQREAYTQIRFIGVHNGGRELVRVNWLRCVARELHRRSLPNAHRTPATQRELTQLFRG